MRIYLVFMLLALLVLVGCAKSGSQNVDIIEKLYAADPARQMIGKELPSFSITDLVTGRVVSSEDWKDRVILINSLIIGCPSCLEEIPKLDQLHDKYGDRLVILELDINLEDTPEQVLKVKEQLNGRNYLWAISGETGKVLMIEGADWTYIIKNGVVVYADSYVVPVQRLENFVKEAFQ